MSLGGWSILTRLISNLIIIMFRAFKIKRRLSWLWLYTNLSTPNIMYTYQKQKTKLYEQHLYSVISFVFFDSCQLSNHNLTLPLNIFLKTFLVHVFQKRTQKWMIVLTLSVWTRFSRLKVKSDKWVTNYLNDLLFISFVVHSAFYDSYAVCI